MGLLSFISVLRARAFVLFWAIGLSTLVAAALGFALPKNYVA